MMLSSSLPYSRYVDCLRINCDARAYLYCSRTSTGLKVSFAAKVLHIIYQSPFDAGIQIILPSAPTLIARSTWNLRGNSRPIRLVLTAVLLFACIHNCASQLCIIVFCPATRSLPSRLSIRLSIRHGICIYILVISGRRRKTYRNVR
jgi:hypothetical protein